MGIQGLIPFLEKATRQVNVRQYSGCCVAVDAYCWLHKGAFSCAEKLARGEKCDAYVYYCMKFVNMLLSHNIKPILVFDGRHLPAKADTESKRREARENNRTRAAQLLRAGRTDEARSFIRRCVDVTHEMALAVIQECQKRNVDCIVAPYEADAQLAYLNIKNIAQIVITEDSDLVLFGCSRILFKMDVGGNGLLVEQEKLFLTMGIKPHNYSFEKFRRMCILSGCDYLPSLPGIGLVKACKFIKKISEPDIRKALLRLPSYLNLRNVEVTDEYRDSFLLAESAFLYQLVFDPISRKLVHLTPAPENFEHVEFVGKKFPNDVAYQLALGNLEPFTLKKVADFDPDRNTQTMNRKTDSWNQTSVAPHISVWSREYKKPKPLPPSPDVRQVERSTTKGKSTTVKLKLFSPPKATSNECEEFNDKDIVSMYGEAEEPPSKRPCIKDLNDEVSPDLSLKRRRNPFAIRSENCSDISEEPSKSIFEIMSPPNSPKKSSPYKENTSPSILDINRRKVFSALKNFGKFQQLPHEKTVVKSRYFSKEESVSPKRPSPTESKCEVNNFSISSPGKLTDLTPEDNKDDMLPIEDEDDKELARLLGLEYNMDFDKSAEESPPVSVPQTFNSDKVTEQSSICLTPPVSQPSAGVFKWGSLHSKYSFQNKQLSVRVCNKSKSVGQGFKRPSQNEEDVDDPDELDFVDSKETDTEVQSSSLDSDFQSDIQCSGSSSVSISEQEFITSEEVSNSNKYISPPRLKKVCTPLSGKTGLRVGLSKSRKAVDKQQTLLNMFGFQKKPKLVHS